MGGLLPKFDFPEINRLNIETGLNLFRLTITLNNQIVSSFAINLVMNCVSLAVHFRLIQYLYQIATLWWDYAFAFGQGKGVILI